MTLRVVFLDRASIIADVRRPRAASDYLEYPRTQAEEVVERLQGATVAITNKVPLRAETLRGLPQLRMIAVAATGYDLFRTLHPHHGDPAPALVMTGHQWVVLAIGFVVSFIVALGVVKWFLHWVRQHGFAIFAGYRILVGVWLLWFASR